MIAFHFPPVLYGSGAHRAYSFAKFLALSGYKPIVVTASKNAYPEKDMTLNLELPKEVIIAHAFAIDSARHLSLNGKYFGMTALPDRWVTWLPDLLQKKY